MPIEKGIVFLRNFGLEFDEDEDLIYIEDARYHLSCHQWEVDIVTVSHDFVYGHIYVQTHLEALVKHCQNYLQAHIDQDYDKDHLSLTMEQFKGIVGAFTLEFAHTATVAQTVVHFADFVDHGLENDGMKIVLHFFGELLPMLVHLVTNLAATGHKFICSRLVVRIPHYLLYTKEGDSENYVRHLLARVMTLAMKVKRFAADLTSSMSMKRFLMNRLKLVSQCLK